MMNLFKSSALALLVYVWGHPAIAQDSGRLLFQDIEAEVNYSNEPMAVFEMHSCEAVNWAYSANWGDGQETPSSADLTPTHINDKNFRLRDRGTYSVWFSHVYHVANINPGYHVVLRDSGQCAGFNYPVGVFDHKYPMTLRVWGRVPVEKVTVLNPQLHRRDTLRVEIQLNGTAPASNTRVYLKVQDGLISPKVQFLVIPSGATKIETEFVVNDSAPFGRHSLGAWTAKDQQTHPPSGAFEVIH